MPHYDFNWQRDYIFKDLIEIPAGTKVVADYWYDNSANNKALQGGTTKALTNPARRSSGASQSFQEMLFTAIQFRWKGGPRPSRAMTSRQPCGKPSC